MLLSRLFDFIAPRYCCVCGSRLTAEERVFCAGCCLDLPLTEFLDHPYDNVMAKTFWGLIPHFERAYALVYHVPHTRSASMVYQLKYNNRPDIGDNLGWLMADKMAAKGFFEGIDAVVPVPLAPVRIRQRGYNQSECLAYGICRRTHQPLWDDVVGRKYYAASQTDKNRWQRLDNVTDVFELTNGSRLRGRHVLIVDDVVTTGATVCALAKQLQLVDDVHISVASIAFAGEVI